MEINCIQLEQINHVSFVQLLYNEIYFTGWINDMLLIILLLYQRIIGPGKIKYTV